VAPVRAAIAPDAPTAPATGERPAAAPPPAAAVGPPQVLIDRIEVITPPARAPAPDPLASLADRRRGASRHGRGGR
jgi:hypothetical protein